jgi:hypothetical protein
MTQVKLLEINYRLKAEFHVERMEESFIHNVILNYNARGKSKCWKTFTNDQRKL